MGLAAAAGAGAEEDASSSSFASEATLANGNAPAETKEIFVSMPGGGKMPASGLGMCCR